MKKLFLIACTILVTTLVWLRQHGQRELELANNDRLARDLAESQAALQDADAARQKVEDRKISLSQQLALRKRAVTRTVVAEPAANPSTIVEPDASHHGGWPPGAGYFYLPKEWLTNANYKLLNGGQLTDEAAALLGMSAAERATVNQSVSDMLNQFRQLELVRMQHVPPPSSWDNAIFGATRVDSVVTYQIPSLTADVNAAKQSFTQQLEQTLGASRAQLFNQGADSYLRQNLDDLGSNDRTVGFYSVTEQDGSPALWYAIADAAHGEGSFQRVPENVEANSQIAYYANLFGVKLPGK